MAVIVPYFRVTITAIVVYLSTTFAHEPKVRTNQKWKGQGHSAFLPSLDLHTQERTCADQDPAFVAYLETFGQRCYLTPSGVPVNATYEGTRIRSWAAFPREYHLDDRDMKLTSQHYSLVMLWIEVSQNSVTLNVKNLSRYPLESSVIVSGVSNKEIPVALPPYGEQCITAELQVSPSEELY